MMVFRLTELAKQDLRFIGRYTQVTWGKEQRNLYLAKIDAVFHLLAQEPQRGKACDEI
jgi:toxin ParE1/3/4